MDFESKTLLTQAALAAINAPFALEGRPLNVLAVVVCGALMLHIRLQTLHYRWRAKRMSPEELRAEIKRLEEKSKGKNHDR